MTTAPAYVSRKTPVWAKILLVLVILLAVGGAAVAGVAIGRLLGASETRSVQVVKSVQQEEQVILLTAGMSDEYNEQNAGLQVLPFFTLPGSERTLSVQYDFDAKFGIEGKDVKIRPNGDKAFVISIPEFQFLGYDNPRFKVLKDQNGLLSWTTPELDKLDAAEKTLTDEAVAKQRDGFRPLLED